ncbi:MAG: hypothetical protein OXC00_08565 [Acidimicrobiaceae bacterium]|nr:hypothetical protein [Acidimicrobiaceae bacterium]
MDSTFAATVIGVLLSACFGAFATSFAWLRSDINARFDKMDDKVDARFERLETKVDGLIMRLARSRLLTEPEDLGSDD